MMCSPKRFPIPLVHINETNSTNNYLQALCARQQTEEFTTVVADFQTSGRGQRGNSWEAEPDKNLLFSFVIFPVFLEARQQFLISQIVSLAIKEELDTYISQSIAGVGININQEVFHSSAPNPVSLFQITGKQYDIFNILEHIMLRIQIYYDLLQKNNTALITAQYERSLFRKEGMYRYKDVNGEFMANIVCVEPEGRLILEDETQTKRGYMFKEVEYLLK